MAVNEVANMKNGKMRMYMYSIQLPILNYMVKLSLIYVTNVYQQNLMWLIKIVIRRIFNKKTNL